MTRVSAAVVLLVAACLGSGLAGCASAQSAAARDPMKCERDPSCARYRGSYADCTRQCSDGPECMQHCEEMQRTVDRIGR